MTDYSPLLRKAISDLVSPDERARYERYEAVRQALIRQLRIAGRSESEMDEEVDALQAAVRRLESEIANLGRRQTPQEPLEPDRKSRDREISALLADSTGWLGLGGKVAIAFVVILAVGLAAGTYYIVTLDRHVLASREAPKPAPAAKEQQANPAELSYVLRRQRVYYRTTHPPGTIVVSTNQKFLYLVQPNQAAIRYAISVGPVCDKVAGMFRITEKIARPDAANASGVAAPSAGPAAKPGARFEPTAIYFDGDHAVHETSQLDIIGQAAAIGCFQSLSQDIADLFGRISLDERVVVAN